MQEIASRVVFRDEEAFIQRTQDCTPVAERAKEMQRAGLHGSSEVKLAASIPNILIEQYCLDNDITYREWCVDPAHIRRMLEDPALAHFRIWPGRI
ncbi:hypothetical protein [Variovorax paradoxus]|uniref:hypothetical protein n=1 Tax=Variovorax paradoxus TaxID=34073 RepID=UPI00248147BA|nr:hypothetical protein [Variovorax paradoxus]WGT64793.1 hypothetical protein QHG62_05480 [Variovorax paradoxus]